MTGSNATDLNSADSKFSLSHGIKESAHGFKVILVNARYSKNLLARKIGVSDAAKLSHLHSYGLLRKSFRPAAEIATVFA